jgi:hypothetical protein
MAKTTMQSAYVTRVGWNLPEPTSSGEHSHVGFRFKFVASRRVRSRSHLPSGVSLLNPPHALACEDYITAGHSSLCRMASKKKRKRLL